MAESSRLAARPSTMPTIEPLPSHHPRQKTAPRPAKKGPARARTRQAEFQPLFRHGILPPDACRNRVQFDLRLAHGHSVLDAHVRKGILNTPLIEPVDPFERCFIRHGNENVGLQKLLRPIEALRSNAHDRVRMLRAKPKSERRAPWTPAS